MKRHFPKLLLTKIPCPFCLQYQVKVKYHDKKSNVIITKLKCRLKSANFPKKMQVFLGAKMPEQGRTQMKFVPFSNHQSATVRLNDDMKINVTLL